MPKKSMRPPFDPASPPADRLEERTRDMRPKYRLRLTRAGRAVLAADTTEEYRLAAHFALDEYMDVKLRWRRLLAARPAGAGQWKLGTASYDERQVIAALRVAREDLDDAVDAWSRSVVEQE